MTDEDGCRVIVTSDTEVRLHNGLQDEAMVTREDDGGWHVRPLLPAEGLDDGAAWPAFDSKQEAIDAYLRARGAGAGDDA
ncbi:MAG: hypothetical protein JWP66_699 [Naasia sp.]|nr:hypothetical protein [Naasia sp.]